MNVAMWGKAVRVIPRVSKDEWDALDVVSRWLIATRSAVLVMTFNASAIAGLLALRDGRFHLLPWLMVTVGLLFAHATNNLINDLTDHLKGVDKDNYFRSQYGPQPLEHGLMTRGQLLTYIAVTGAIALAAGLYLVAVRGEATLALLAIGAFFVLFYT
jgi:1,4-dihydroxy-2-naphthoate octaprenyltransferase